MKGLDRSLPVSLYIHVPFCARKCDYCAFYSVKAEEALIESYTGMLLMELDAVIRECDKPFETIFIGGGNPGILGMERLSRILEKAEERGKPEEVTAEINPENVTDDLILLEPYLTRVSIGVQSFDQRKLAMLGRNSSAKSAERALSLLASLPFDFNADLIASVPGETQERLLCDIERLVSYNPDHISLYSLSIEEGTPLSLRAAPLGEDEEIAILEAGWQALRGYGYRHYEISNFAKEGKECLHNLVYWNLGQYIGIGPGAESSLGYREALSMRDSESLEEYLRGPVMDVHPLSAEETMEEVLLASLRTEKGICKEEYSRRFGEDFDTRYAPFIERLDRDLYINTERSFSLTEKGFLLSDRIILELAMAI